MKLKSLLIGVASSTLIVSAASAGSITAVSWGGAYTKSQVEAYHKPLKTMEGVLLKLDLKLKREM